MTVMRNLLTLLLVISQPVFAETFYVRNAGSGEYGLEDGTSYANAFDGFQDVPYNAADTAGQVDSGDTLIICGTHDTTSVESGTQMLVPQASGASDSERIIFDGDCSSQGDLSMAILNGGGAYDRGIDSGGSGQSYLTFKNLKVTGFDTFGILSQSTNTTVRAWLFENVEVYEIRGLTAQCFDLRGAGHTLTNVRTSNCGQDNVYVEGDNFTWNGGYALGASIDSVTGDGLQMNAETENFLISDVEFSSPVDIKQCVIVQSTTGAASGTLKDSTCVGPSTAASNHTSFFFDGLSGTINFFNNYAKNSRYLVYAANGVSLKAYNNAGNDFSDHGMQCGTGSTTCEFYHNTIIRAPICFSTGSASGTSIIQNNIGTDCTTVGIRKNSGDTESYNNIFRSTNDADNDGVDTTLGTGGILTNPLIFPVGTFDSIADFTPRYDSPVKGAGTYVSSVLRDGSRRLFGNPRNMGVSAITNSYTRSSYTTRTQY